MRQTQNLKVSWCGEIGSLQEFFYHLQSIHTLLHCVQDVNLLVFPVIVANCAGWVGYSLVQLNVYMFVANALGLLLGLFYTLIALRFAGTRARPAASLHCNADALCTLLDCQAVEYAVSFAELTLIDIVTLLQAQGKMLQVLMGFLMLLLMVGGVTAFLHATIIFVWCALHLPRSLA